MRILLVNSHGTDRSFGGAERRVHYLAAGFRARGHDVQVLCAFPPRGEPVAETHVLHRNDRDEPLRRLRNHIGDVVSAPWPRLRALLGAMQPDLVHTHNLPGIGTGIWEAARRGGIPVVHSILDYYLLCPRTSLLWRDGSPCTPHPLLCGARTRRLVRWHEAVGTILGTSKHVLRVHRGLFPVAIEHTVPPPMMAAAGTPLRPAATPPATLGYLGSLTPEKGVTLLLDAAPLLAQGGLTLRIAGDGPLRSAVERADHIEYAGRLEGEDLGRFLDSCDVGLVPSLWDEPGGVPFVIGEWLAAGRPVLTTRRGGLAEAERIGGVVMIEESPTSLADTALNLRVGRHWRRLLAAVPMIDSEASLDDWLNRHRAIYDAAIERATSRD